jgi:hypothetical protein
MSANLAAQQTALLDLLHTSTIHSVANYVDNIRGGSLFSIKTPEATLRGLRAYRANAQILSESALGASYPVLQQLMGEDNFRHLAQDFWQTLPPERGDLAQWGGALHTYLPQVPQLQALLHEHPFLPDIARAEWALHLAATASDAQLNAASFQLLTQHEPEQLELILSPGCALIRSLYPVVALIHLHDPRASDAHAEAREAIAQCEPQTALIWRQGLRPVIGLVDGASAALIEAALQGQPLSAALDAAFAQNPDFNFSAWLAAKVQSGLLLGACVASAG